MSADALALEADFFAIGTNDLTAHTLAVDRGESDVSEMYDPLHPAVLRLIQFATEAALRMRMPVSLCGEMAGDPRVTPLLLGLGLRAFSMNASAVPAGEAGGAGRGFGWHASGSRRGGLWIRRIRSKSSHCWRGLGEGDECRALTRALYPGSHRHLCGSGPASFHNHPCVSRNVTRTVVP